MSYVGGWINNNGMGEHLLVCSNKFYRSIHREQNGHLPLKRSNSPAKQIAVVVEGFFFIFYKIRRTQIDDQTFFYGIQISI